MVMRSPLPDAPQAARRAGIFPIHDIPRHEQSPLCGVESTGVIADMVSVLSNQQHGSTAEALAFLRQLYPRYPLTLRLAAIVAHSKTQPQFALERPVAQ